MNCKFFTSPSGARQRQFPSLNCDLTEINAQAAATF